MESSLVFKVILQIVSFKKSRVVFKSIFESVFEFFFTKKLCCVLTAKAIYDGVVFLLRSCGGATRPSEEQHLRSSIDRRSIVRSRLSNDRHAARLRGSLTISKCVLLLLLFKMNATRDWNRKGSSCGGVLGQLSHEVLVQHCLSSGLSLNDHTPNMFLKIAIT